MHGFRCYDNIAPNAKCQRVFVLAVRLVGISRGLALADVFFGVLQVLVQVFEKHCKA